MFSISKDTPAYYITSVTNNRLPVFRTPKMKDVMCAALNEARTSANLLLFAYVVMIDHYHLLLGSTKDPSDVLRFVNGISSRRVIDYLKQGNFEESLNKLSREQGDAPTPLLALGSSSKSKANNGRGRLHAEGALHP